MTGRMHLLLQVFLARGNVPAESYNFFIDILLNTIRSVLQSLVVFMYIIDPSSFKTPALGMVHLYKLTLPKNVLTN